MDTVISIGGVPTPKPTPRLSKSYTNDTNTSSITQEDIRSGTSSLEHETSSHSTSSQDTSDSFHQRREFWETIEQVKGAPVPPLPTPRLRQARHEDSRSLETDTSSIRSGVADIKHEPEEDSFRAEERLEDESFPISESDVSDVAKKLSDVDKQDKSDREQSISISSRGEFVERFEATESDVSEHQDLKAELGATYQPHPTSIDDDYPREEFSREPSRDQGSQLSSDEEVDGDDRQAAFYIGDKSDNIITRTASERRLDYSYDNEAFQGSVDDHGIVQGVSVEPPSTDYVHVGLDIYDEQIINLKDDKDLSRHLIQTDIDDELIEEETVLANIKKLQAEMAEKSETERAEKKVDLDFSEQACSAKKEWKPVLHSPIEKEIALERSQEIGDQLPKAELASAIEVVPDYTSNKSQEILKKTQSEQERVFEQAFAEIKDSLDAVQEELIGVVKDGKSIKQSPSEFEIKFVPHEQSLPSHPEEHQGVSHETSTSTVTATTSIIKIQAPSESDDASLKADDPASSADESLNKLEVIKRRATSVTPSSQRWSVTDVESSSGESHYQSFEQSSSRPQSSDIEKLYPSSEYDTALSQTPIQGSATTTEYHSAVSTLPSNTASMKSFDSESSGNLASIEASEASETLVPSQMEECEADIIAAEEEELQHDDSDKSGSLEEKEPGILLEPEPEPLIKLKRSHEMIFTDDSQSGSTEQLDDIKRTIADQQRFEGSTDDMKFGSLEDAPILASSLDEGSLLSVSLSSASNIETVMENLPEGADVVGSLIGSYDSGKIYLSRSQEDTAPTPTVFDQNDQPDHSIITTEAELSESQQSTEATERAKRRGHRRSDSTSVHPISLIKTDDEKADSFESSELDDEMIVHEDQPKPSVALSSGTSGEGRDESSDSDFDRYETEYSRSFRAPTTQDRRKKDKIIPDEGIQDVIISRSRSPSYSFIETIVEDVTAETEEETSNLIKLAELDTERRASQIAPTNIPDIQVTDDREVEGTDDEEPERSLRQEIEERTSAFSPVQYAQQVEYKMTEEEYQEMIDRKYRQQEADRYGYDDDYDDPNKPESPGSDSFEMLEQPDISDEFVIVEEVAKEAQEFDTEGKSVGIKRVKLEKKGDEDVERLLVKSAPAATDAGSQALHQGEGPFEFEESPPIDSDQEQREVGNGYPLEGSKRWVEMQLNDPANLRYPYELQTGVLEDIKEEDTDLEVGSSRISSFKDSFSSTPDYELISRKLHARDNDNISMSSLQEFESLEHVISLENKKAQQSSEDSLSNGSYPKRHLTKPGSVPGDDISVSSLKDFEALEDASLEAVLLEIRAKEEAALLLSRSDESNKSDGSNGHRKLLVTQSSPRVTSTVTTTTTIIQKTGSEPPTVTQVTKKETILSKNQIEDDDSLNVMEVSTDSLEGSKKLEKDSAHHASTDSLEKNNTNADIMSSSIDSIEIPKAGGGNTTKSTSRSDSIEQSLNDVKKSESIDSIELQQAIARHQSRIDRDSLEDVGAYEIHSGSRQIVTHTSTRTSTTAPYTSEMQKEFSSDSIASHGSGHHEQLLTSTESIETSSTATNATFTNDANSQMSGSVTSCDSTTLIDNIPETLGQSSSNYLLFDEHELRQLRSPHDTAAAGRRKRINFIF